MHIQLAITCPVLISRTAYLERHQPDRPDKPLDIIRQGVALISMDCKNIIHSYEDKNSAFI
jgi:hypothetical protein